MLRGSPWELARGDIAHNVRELAANAAPPNLDPRCGQKVERSLDVGYSFEMIIRAVKLLRDVAWGTRAVEQGHGSCAVIHRFHPSLSVAQLCCRSMLHQSRALFTPCPDHLAAARVQAKLDKLRSKRIRMDGRKAYLRVFMDQVLETIPVGSKPSQSLVRGVLQHHGAMHRSLAPSVRAGYEARAEQMAAVARDNLASDIEHVEDQLRLSSDRCKQAARERGSSNQVGCHRFSDDDMQALLVCSNASVYDAVTVKSKWDKLISPPPAVPASVLAVLAAHAPVRAPAVRKLELPWQKRLCVHRASVFGTVFGRAVELDGQDFYAFIFACQRPQEAWFLRMYRHVEQVPLGCTNVLWHSQKFVAHTNVWVPHDQLPYKDGNGFVAIEGLAFQDDGSLAGNSLPQPLSDWEDGWPLPTPSAGTSSRRLSTSKLEELKKAHPWFDVCMNIRGRGHCVATGSMALRRRSEMVMCLPERGARR